MVNMKYCRVQISNELSWLNHFKTIFSQLSKMPKKSKGNILNREINGSNGIPKNIIIHLSFYFSVRLFKFPAYIFVNIIINF